jgi:hypothetical protein
MQFTEHELTAAVAVLARTSFESLPGFLRQQAGATSWDDLPKPARYPYLKAAGDFILPAFAALPERPTIGATPNFTNEEYERAARAALKVEEGRLDRGQRKAVKASAPLIRLAIEALPLRHDPDSFVVPDHL